MSWSGKFLVLLLLAAAEVPAWADGAQPVAATSPQPSAKPSPGASAQPGKDKDKSKDDSGKKDKKDKRKKSEFTVPIPQGHSATGIKLPSYGRDGKLQMSLVIDLAKRLDDLHLEMNHVFLETYNDDGSPDLTLQSVSSVLELKTRIVTSLSPTTVRRSDFQISGNNLVFDTKLRNGKFTGETRTVIYNLSQAAESDDKKPEAKQ